MSDRIGVNSILIGPPGAGKGTQVNKCTLLNNTF